LDLEKVYSITKTLYVNKIVNDVVETKKNRKITLLDSIFFTVSLR